MKRHLVSSIALNVAFTVALSVALTVMTTFTPAATAAQSEDPYLWLEDVGSERALAWVRERNQQSRAALEAHPRFASMRARFLEILDSREKIPNVTRHGEHLYNLWQDAKHPRGLWRRTPLAEYRKAEPAWEPVLDLDALGVADKENWVWKGATCFGPAHERCILALSRGGADATVLREFDTSTKRFVAAKDRGFVAPEAKSFIDWIDADTVYIGTDFGAGSMTDSGYPRVIKRWRRGTPLAEAVTVFEGQSKDVAAWVGVDRTPGFERTVFGRATDFYNNRQWLLHKDGKTAEIAFPSDAAFTFWRDKVLLQLRSDWKTADNTVWPRGALLVAEASAYLEGARKFTALFTPTPTRSLEAFTTTHSRVLLSVLDNVAGRVEEWHPAPDGARWIRREVKAPFPGTLGLQSLHEPLQGAKDPLGERYLITYADFLTPDALMLGATDSDERETLKQRPRFFDSTGMRVEQRFAASKDGTRVPYFVVWPKGARADGDNPTLLYGYGGFEVSQQPWYSGAFGSAWFAHGGVLAVANIRGGGEFGPAWHQAAVGANKQNSYDDFIAVAQDLIASKVTQPQRLGIQGGSNGGLLVGATMLQRPDLFRAVVCQVPLLDMKRYTRLLAGASWIAEYGDPDKPDEWAHIAKYSPYQNVEPGMKLPDTLLITSTRDDRVHPGHARKMAARLAEQGHPHLYYENIEGGHAGAADNKQRADMMALEFSFLWQRLGR
jgi:prolyl oligopeptidase